MTGVVDHIWTVSLHLKERRPGSLILEILHVILVKGGKGKPGLSMGLGNQKVAMLISDLITTKQRDVA